MRINSAASSYVIIDFQVPGITLGSDAKSFDTKEHMCFQ